MGSRLDNEKKFSEENNLEECEILHSSSKGLKSKKSKSSFKSPVSNKQLNIQPETKNLKNKRDKLEDNADEKTKILRRSKRRKSSDACMKFDQIVLTNRNNDLPNGIKTTEFENLSQNDSINLIPKNVMKTLDEELFPGEADEEQNLNVHYIEPALNQNEHDDTKEGKSESVITEVGNTVLIRMEVDYNIRSQMNFLKVHDESSTDNKHKREETCSNKENIEENGKQEISNQQLLSAPEDKEKYTKNITKSITNIEEIDDTSLDRLNLNIKKADDIIYSLTKPADTENSVSEKRHVSNSELHLSESNSMNEYFHPEKNNNTLNEHSFDSKPSTSSKNSLIVTDDQQLKNVENINYMKKYQSEKQNEISSCSDKLAIKQKHNGAKCNSLSNKGINSFDDNTIISENFTGITKTLHVHDSSKQSNNQMLPENKTNNSLVENYSSHRNNDLSNSQKSNIQIQNSHPQINYNEKSTDKTKNTSENLETKCKTLTLLYMSALDYEKENKEHDIDILEKNNETENEILHSDVGEEYKNNDISYTEKNIETPEQNFDYLSKTVDGHNTKPTLNIHTHQNINQNRISNGKEVGEDEQQNSEKEKKDTFSLNINQIDNDITVNEQYNANDLSPIKCDLCCKGTNKKHNFQEHFIALKFHENIPSSQTSSNFSGNNNGVNFEAINAENRETQKWQENKCFQELDTTFIVTAADCFKSEKSEEITNDRKDKIIKNFSEDKTSREDADVDASFDMDDDFDLTASQINMIEINENSQYKKLDESKSCMKIENSSNTHFGQDSITVEIMDNLCYIRESVDSIKELLKTFMKKTDAEE